MQIPIYCRNIFVKRESNVYTVGATTFVLFGGYERTMDKWELTEQLFAVAAKAVSNDRSARQQSIKQLREEWEAEISSKFQGL